MPSDRPDSALRAAAPTPDFWHGRRVFLTGHTGFKGSWLALWLNRLGADVVGYGLPQPDERALFHRAGIDRLLTSVEGDVRDAEHLVDVIARERPEIVIHMAAQALVRHSFAHPLETYATNVMGTAHVLDAVRRTDGVRVVLNVTSDKCYDNREVVRPYREDDPMGGADPYSSSKGAAELVTSAYRRSYFPIDRIDEHGVAVASVRAGNVIGGGDWAADRLVVDVVSSFLRGEAPVLRHPQAIRPWQFVLDPLAGYLALAEHAYASPERFATGWNFGPDVNDCRPVAWLVERLAEKWGAGAEWRVEEDPTVHEARLLLLDARKARMELGWRPRMSLDDAIAWTVAWYRGFERSEDVATIARDQIGRFEELAVAA